MGFVSNLFSSDPYNYQASTTNPQYMSLANDQASTSVDRQRAFVDALGQNQQSAINNQALLGNLLAQGATGNGPSVAQNQYQQNVNNLAAQQAGAISSQKGISPALAARMIAQQGGAAMQNAAGQAATLKAQEQLGAQQALGNFTSQQIAQQQNALGGYSQAALGQQQNLYGLQSNANSVNAGLAQQKIGTQGQVVGSMFNALGAAAGGGGGWNGGEVQNPSGFAKYLSQGGGIPGQGTVPGDSPKNDVVPAMLSPKEIVLPRSVTMAKDAPKKAMEFVAAIKAKNGLKK